METFRYVVAVLTVVGLPPGVGWWFVVHPFVGFWRRVGVRGTLWTVGSAAVGAAVGLYLVRDALVGPDLGTRPPLMALGVLLVAAAVFVGVQRKRHLTFRILAGVPELEGEDGGTLLTEGPYAIVRHPRYVEVALAMLGYACLANYLGVYVVVLLCIPVLHAVVLLEERELAQRFGDEWTAYRERVPRWLPRWRRARPSRR